MNIDVANRADQLAKTPAKPRKRLERENDMAFLTGKPCAAISMAATRALEGPRAMLRRKINAAARFARCAEAQQELRP
jgi:hypothetical protein